MNYRIVGSSDLHVSEVSFGCMSLDGSSAQKEKLLLQAFDQGINFFDTADLYDQGENEKVIGQALKSIRQKVIIATKVGNQWRADGSGWDWNPSKAYILEAVEKSLHRLQTDYLDLYQLHGGTIQDPMEETIEAFELLKQQGKIRQYGISSIRPNVIRDYVRKSGISSVMMQYSLLDRRPEEEALPLLEKNQISVLARGSLAQGLLAGKPSKQYLDLPEAEVNKAVKELKRVAEARQEPLTTTALQYVLADNTVASAVVGIRTEEQLLEAVSGAKANPLSLDQLSSLKAAIAPLRYQQHR